MGKKEGNRLNFKLLFFIFALIVIFLVVYLFFDKVRFSPDDGKIVYYQFDNALYESAQNKNVSFNTGVIFSNDSIFGMSGTFSNKKSFGIKIDVPETEYTYSTWFKTNDSYGSFITAVYPISNSASSHDRQFGMWGGKVCHRVWPDVEAFCTNQSYNDNLWHFAAVTLGSNGLSIYVDGALQSYSAKYKKSGFGWQNGIIIGGHQSGNSGKWDYYNGLLDELSIYNRALSEDEINGLYDEGACYGLGECRLYQTKRVDLVQGANYLTWPLEVKDQILKNAILNPTQDLSLDLWDSKSKSWSRIMYDSEFGWYDGEFNSINDMKISPGEGFAIQSPQPSILRFLGSEYSSQYKIELNSGFNLIGAPYCINGYVYSAQNMLNEMRKTGADCYVAMEMNSNQQIAKWYSINNYISQNGKKENFELKNGKAYFIGCQDKGINVSYTWVPFCSDNIQVELYRK